MFEKNAPLKIVLIIFITEIIILVGMGLVLQINILNVNNKIE